MQHAAAAGCWLLAASCFCHWSKQWIILDDMSLASRSVLPSALAWLDQHCRRLGRVQVIRPRVERGHRLRLDSARRSSSSSSSTTDFFLMVLQKIRKFNLKNAYSAIRGHRAHDDTPCFQTFKFADLPYVPQHVERDDVNDARIYKSESIYIFWLRPSCTLSIKLRGLYTCYSNRYNAIRRFWPLQLWKRAQMFIVCTVWSAIFLRGWTWFYFDLCKVKVWMGDRARILKKKY